MGLRDLFKDKKKEAFKEKAKEVTKGRLAPGKAEELAAVAREHGQEPADDKTALRRSIYNQAAGAAKGRGKLTSVEAQELTDKRLFLRAVKSAAVEYSPQANLYLYSDGLRIERTVGNTILRFKSKSDGTAEIVGELLSALMR